MAVRTSAAEFLPQRMNLTALRRAAEVCKGCDLYKNATQTVFGRGARRARIMLVGEMPGDEEDRQGEPFVGPAGRLLDKSLQAADIARSEVYVTNAVKHFRWEPRGKRRLHKKPGQRQIEACKPWLQAEILVVEPEMLVCLGATAAQALIGRDFRITRQRGEFFESAGTGIFDDSHAPFMMATYHPSAILRAPDKEDRDRMRAELVADLRSAKERLATSAAYV